jgi:hypothetical protein
LAIGIIALSIVTFFVKGTNKLLFGDLAFDCFFTLLCCYGLVELRKKIGSKNKAETERTLSKTNIWYGWVLPIIVFGVLIVIYFRNAIFADNSAFLTRHLATDDYAYSIAAFQNLAWFKHGIFNIGDFWIPRGGGYPVVPQDQLLNPTNILLMTTYAITNNFAVSFRILIPLFYFLILVVTYWYGTIIFKRRDASIILAIAYTFSMYGVLQLEHLDLLLVQIFVILTLIFFEKALSAPGKTKPAILVSLILFLVYATELYAFYFTVIFLAIRFIFHLATKPERKKALKSIAIMIVPFLLLAVPLLMPQLLSVPSINIKTQLGADLNSLAQSPGTFFIRGPTDVPTPEVDGSFYIGIIIITLLIIPIITDKTDRNYNLFLFIALFSIIYSAGNNFAINISGWVQAHVPLSFFLRAAPRIMIIGYLAFAICAAAGSTILIDKFKSNRIKIIMLLGIIILVFCDMSISYTPTDTTWVFNDNAAYEWIQKQPGDFRILEIPSTYLQMATTDMSTGHDTFSSYAWGHGYFNPQYDFTDLYQDNIDMTVSAQDDAYFGVKYLILILNQTYYTKVGSVLAANGNPELRDVQKMVTYFNNTPGFKLVYDVNGYLIYEDTLYTGTVFSGNTSITYTHPNSNTYIIDNPPTQFTISQGYSPGWVTSIGTIKNENNLQEVTVPAGTKEVTVYYQYHDASLLVIGVYLLTFFLVVFVRKKWLILGLGSGILIFSLFFYPYTSSIYHNAITILGILIFAGSIGWIVKNRVMRLLM